MEKDTLFTSYNVPLKDIVSKYIVCSQALSEEQIAPSLQNAVGLFLLPVLGEELVEHLCHVSASDSAGEVEAMALDEARCAAVNLAVWHDFTELNVHFTDQGWKREEGDTYKSLYHYQEIDLQTSYRNKGFNAIDRLVRFLSAAKHVFPEIVSAPAYIEKEKALVRGPEEVEQFFTINKSPLVYMALRPNLKIVQENELQNVMGSQCYDKLMAYLDDTNKADREDASVMGRLRSAAASYVICLALARQVESFGTLTDRGMYFESVSAGLRNSVKVTPVDEPSRRRISHTLRRDAERYLGRLLNFIEYYLPEVFVGRPGDAFNRDNNCKRTFWA